MSSRPADPSIGLKPRAQLSITVRLAALYAVSAYIMLVLATAFLYWILSKGIERDDVHFVVDKVQRIEWILLHHPDDTDFLGYEVNRDGGKPYAFYARILNERGQLIIETPGMSRAIPSEQFPPPAVTAQHSELELVKKWDSPEGSTFCIVSAWARKGPSGQSRVIQVAMNDAEEEDRLAKLRYSSLAVLLIGTLLSAGIGSVVARRGMMPLRQIVVTAERITANRLNERLDPARWPEELDALALTLNRMLGRLEESFARMSQCGADLAHELRTPINNLIGEAEVVLLTDRTPEEYRRVVESSLEEFDRLARMINDILFLARVENPQKMIERVPLDMRHELEAVTEFFEALSETHGVTVISEGHGSVDADPLLFRRAVINLLSNALRATPRGGRITLSAKQAEDNVAVVEVADTGCGIPLEQLPTICDRQNCANRAIGQCSGENGLGLSIVKSIVELHGGSIAVESALGKGTTILLRFPTSIPAAA